MDNESEHERSNSEIKIFVDSANGYVGSAVVNGLIKMGYQVFALEEISPKVQLVSSRKEGILSTELSVFENLEDPTNFKEALDIVNSNPLHRPIKMAVFTTLLTWGGRTFPKEEEEDKKESTEENTEQAEVESIEKEEGEVQSTSDKTEEEEVDDDKEPENVISEDDFLQRVPLVLVQQQYYLENRALQLNFENDRLDIYLFAVGLIYGLGEKILFPFLRSLWEFKTDTFPVAKNHLSTIHVSNLALAVSQLFSLEEEEQKHYYILSESSPSLKQVGKAFSQILSEGKTREITPLEINEFDFVVLTTDLPSESTFISNNDNLAYSEGILSKSYEVVDEFRKKYSLENLKILVIGPPFSGYEEVGQRISSELDVPILDVDKLVKEAQVEKGEFGDSIREMLEENPKITDEIIVKVLHNNMLKRNCRNKGWVIAGFADNYEKSALLFEEQDPEELQSPQFAHIPTHLILLEATDQEIIRKAASVHNESDKILKKIKQYRKGEKPGDDPDEETKDVLSFYDDRDVKSIIINAFSFDYKVIFDFIGPKRWFGRPPEEIEAELLEKKRIEEEAKRQKEEELKAEMNKQQNEWIQGDSIHEITVQRLEKEDADFLAEKSKVLEEYLDENVMNHVIDGLLELANTKPENPIDKLAAFLFARHRQLSKK